MTTTDTQLQQLVINVGTKAQIEAAIAGGTITEDMLSVTTDGGDYIQGVTLNGTTVSPDTNNVVNLQNICSTDTSQDITATKTFKAAQKIQNGDGTGCLVIGADVNASTITSGTRKLGRVSTPNITGTANATLLGWDTVGDDGSGTDQMHTPNKAYDTVCFGGMKKITNTTSPMNVVFCVNSSRNSTSASDKVYPLELDSNVAYFNVQPKYNGIDLETKATIQTLSATDSITIADNTIYNGWEQTALTIALPATADVSFLCEIDFTSGTTPATLAYPNTIKWLGDDVSNNVFIPVASKRYTIICAYDGVNYRFTVKGVA